jgi:hypothetical protein
LSVINEEVGSLRCEVNNIRELHHEVTCITNTACGIRTEDNTASATTTAVSNKCETTGNVKTYASIASKLNTAVEAPFKSSRQQPKRLYRVCGKAAVSSLPTVDGIRCADIFVTRLAPSISCEDVKLLVKDLLPDCSDISAEQLKTRFDSYSSFHVSLYIPQPKFEELLSSVYNESTWPHGILVRRYFREKNGVKH